jgi:hypothetical protein
MTPQRFAQTVCLLLVIGGLLSPCIAAPDKTQSAPATLAQQEIEDIHKQMDNGLRGVLLATFMDRSSESSPASMITRIKMRTRDAPPIYNIEDQTFVIYVPKDYDPHNKYGLMVYISNIPALVPPADWKKVFDEHHMIWISANNADKKQPVYRRMGLALDAVYNATMRYTIDPDRIYIAGMHSGADLASVLAVHYPQTFAGGLFMHSCLYHRDIPATADDPTTVPEGYRRPMMDKLYRAKTENRYVLLTGEKASNLPVMKAICNRGFDEDRFKHVQLMVMPDTTTGRPDGKWLSKAIDALEPIEVPATAP